MTEKIIKFDKQQMSKIKDILAFILRHKPFFYKIKLNKEGYAQIKYLTKVIENKLKISIAEEDIVSIAKQYSGGIFQINKENNQIRAREGHTIIFNMSPPENFEETEEVPRMLYCKIPTSEVAGALSEKYIFSNKGYVLVSTPLERGNKETVIIIDTKKSKAKGSKYFKKDEEYFTPFVIHDCVSIHV